MLLMLHFQAQNSLMKTKSLSQLIKQNKTPEIETTSFDLMEYPANGPKVGTIG